MSIDLDLCSGGRRSHRQLPGNNRGSGRRELLVPFFAVARSNRDMRVFRRLRLRFCIGGRIHRSRGRIWSRRWGWRCCLWGWRRSRRGRGGCCRS